MTQIADLLVVGFAKGILWPALGSIVSQTVPLAAWPCCVLPKASGEAGWPLLLLRFSFQIVRGSGRLPAWTAASMRPHLAQSALLAGRCRLFRLFSLSWPGIFSLCFLAAFQALKRSPRVPAHEKPLQDLCGGGAQRAS